MNLRNAAALALWYLVVPPPNYVGIPMANWERRAIFDSKACQPVAALRPVQSFLKGTDS
jgi:hypothetical protein